MTGTAAAGGVTLIGWPQLLLASGFVVLTGALALWMQLGVTKDLAIATVRTYVQLLLLGLVLGLGVRAQPSGGPSSGSS